MTERRGLYWNNETYKFKNVSEINKQNINKFKNIEPNYKEFNNEIYKDRILDENFINLNYHNNDSIKTNKIQENNNQKIYKNINIDYTINENILDTIMTANIKNNLLGIINIGNSCYINSIIQILLHCDIFLKNIHEKLNIIINKQNCLKPLTSL